MFANQSSQDSPDSYGDRVYESDDGVLGRVFYIMDETLWGYFGLDKSIEAFIQELQKPEPDFESVLRYRDTILEGFTGMHNSLTQKAEIGSRFKQSEHQVPIKLATLHHTRHQATTDVSEAYKWEERSANSDTLESIRTMLTAYPQEFHVATLKRTDRLKRVMDNLSEKKGKIIADMLFARDRGSLVASEDFLRYREDFTGLDEAEKYRLVAGPSGETYADELLRKERESNGENPSPQIGVSIRCVGEELDVPYSMSDYPKDLPLYELSFPDFLLDAPIMRSFTGDRSSSLDRQLTRQAFRRVQFGPREKTDFEHYIRQTHRYLWAEARELQYSHHCS